NLWFARGDATATGQRGASFDIVFSRALIHHLATPEPMVAEAVRLLRPGGILIIQDRTVEDVLRPASPSHLRGYFFERYPRLIETERERRPATETVVAAMASAGLVGIETVTLSEPRRRYESVSELQDDLRARTGRSILHALSDEELDDLIAYITARVTHAMPIQEADHWTIWCATRPCHQPT
ncbi:MAG TPA: class I SAM-dependent methyltransferase, partial [Thermomicrobiales bacterium]|nr:class I SAM-dependent methyltransferase [Thermomicrobiales bacterium]